MRLRASVADCLDNHSHQVMTQDFNARLTGSDARVHKYETVLAFDRRTRELLEQLPAYFRYDRSDDPDIKAIVQARPYIAYQRCVILYGLNNRLLRAHRPFMARGYLDPKYAYSTDRCIKVSREARRQLTYKGGMALRADTSCSPSTGCKDHHRCTASPSRHLRCG